MRNLIDAELKNDKLDKKIVELEIKAGGLEIALDRIQLFQEHIQAEPRLDQTVVTEIADKAAIEPIVTKKPMSTQTKVGIGAAAAILGYQFLK